MKFNLPFDDYGDGSDDLPEDYRAKSAKIEPILETRQTGVEEEKSQGLGEYKPDPDAIAADFEKRKAKHARDKAAVYPEQHHRRGADSSSSRPRHND